MAYCSMLCRFTHTADFNRNLNMILTFQKVNIMVGNYTRKSNRQSWSEDAMANAIDAIKSGRMGWLKAAKTFNVPQTTLRRRANNTNVRAKGTSKVLGRFSVTFDKALETQLVQHIILLESRLFGVTTTDIKKIAYQFANKNGIQHRFHNDRAGKEWLRGFRKRHPEITLRQPEAVSAARAMAFNRPQIKKFFDTLSSLLEKERIHVHRIYNMDESGLSTVQRPPKVFAKTGRKQVGSLTSAERGLHVTCVCCMNSVGTFVPPALIFPRKNRKNELLDAAPQGTLGLFNESGWMNSDSFVLWLKHFQSFVGASEDCKVLLLLDGHSSHKSLEAVSYAKKNGIIMMCFPAHCTHRIQPLDVAFFGPLKTFYNQECGIWLKNHPGRVITQFQIGKLFSIAYGKAATVHNATSGFLNTGINPFNPNIFPDDFFAPAETTNTVNNETPPASEEAPVMTQEGNMVNQQENREEKKKEIKNGKSKLKFTLQEISPVPVAASSTRRKRKKTPSVLTTTPNLEELKEKAITKRNIEARRCKKNVFQTTTASTSFIEEDVPEDPYASGDEDDECACIYCNDLFKNSKSREVWLQCGVCKNWAHSECAGVPSKSKKFTCDVCI